jgi:hypothetical protein
MSDSPASKMPFVQGSFMHLLFAQNPLLQSVFVVQFLFNSQALQVFPQSISVSVAGSNMLLLHGFTAHLPLEQKPVVQSILLVQFLLRPQDAQLPPQSISFSEPSFIPFKQLLIIVLTLYTHLDKL